MDIDSAIKQLSEIRSELEEQARVLNSSGDQPATRRQVRQAMHATVSVTTVVMRVLKEAATCDSGGEQ